MPPKQKPTPRRESPRSTLSSQLRDAILGRRLSGTSLASASGVDRRAISRWLDGSKDITLSTADRIAAALGLRLAEPQARKQTRVTPIVDTRSVFEVVNEAPPETSAEEETDRLSENLIPAI